MEWIIEIEGKNDQRILIKFNPKAETITFIGQYKPSRKDVITPELKGGSIWFDFSEDSYDMNITDLETFKDHISKVYDKMQERLKIHEDFSKTFGVFKKFEVKED